MKIWNPNLATPAYEQFGGSSSIAGLATELLANSSFVAALALKTDLSEFTFATYTPTFTQNVSVTTSSLTAHYVQVGKYVYAIGEAIFNSSGTTANNLTMTYPVTPNATFAGNNMALGDFFFNRSGVALYDGTVMSQSSTMLFKEANTTGGSVIGTAPAFAVVSGHALRWNITYEAA